MRRITLYIGTSLITFMIGISAASGWSTLSKRPSAEIFVTGFPQQLSTDMSASIVEQELREMERQYDIAQTRRDAAFFEKIEADAFILTYADGTTLTKAQDIALMKTWDPNIKYSSDDLHVQIYGNTAVLTGRVTQTDPDAGNEYSWRWLDLVVKRNGQWQILSTTQVDW